MTVLRYAISLIIAVGLVAFCGWAVNKVLGNDEDEYGSRR